MEYIKDWLEIQFWRMAKLILKKGYGYCDERDYPTGHFMDKGRCEACDASDVQDWIDEHIRLIKM